MYVCMYVCMYVYNICRQRAAAGKQGWPTSRPRRWRIPTRREIIDAHTDTDTDNRRLTRANARNYRWMLLLVLASSLPGKTREGQGCVIVMLTSFSLSNSSISVASVSRLIPAVYRPTGDWNQADPVATKMLLNSEWTIVKKPVSVAQTRHYVEVYLNDDM